MMFRRKKHTPTDLAILDAIHDQYYDTFVGYEKGARNSKAYVPINIEVIARGLKVDPDIVFGRLYYHLQKKHGYTQDDGKQVAFFAIQAGGDRDCVHFPYLASVLASLRYERTQHRSALWVAIAALIISIVSIVVQSWPRP
jgi:hypothetical protein